MTASDQAQPESLAPEFEQALEIDRMISDPVRLVILGVLSDGEEVSFKYLDANMKLSRGNLGFQLSKLEEAGYITVRKYFRGKIPATGYTITPVGKAAIAAYLQRIHVYEQGLQHKEEA